MTDRPVILIIDDESDVHETYRGAFRRYTDDRAIQLVHAYTIQEGLTRFYLNQQQLTVIILDGCVGCTSSTANTIPIAEMVSEYWKSLGDGVQRLLVAASSSDGMRDQLLRAGCHQGRNKRDVPELVLQHLRQHFGLA